jgi:hypothetical protein
MTTINTFGVNGVQFSIQPSDHRWVNQEIVGTTGDGHPIYPAFRSYELEFDFQNASEFNEFQVAFSAIGLTGTASVSLPEFRTYSGTVITQPQYSSYYQNYYQEAKITIQKIRTA